MEIIAHRGACFDAPENSLEAFEAAIVQGADRLELDIQVTADGHAVICHDPSTARVGDRTLEIAFHSLEDVQQVHLANGEPIPTFAALCAVARGRIALDVELKSSSDHAVRSVLDTLEQHGLLSSALITSFDAQVLRRLRLLGYDGRLGLLIGSRSLNLKQRGYEAWPLRSMQWSGASELVIHHMLLHRVLLATLRRKEHPVLLWTAVEDEAKDAATRKLLYEKLVRIQPNGIIIGRIQEFRDVTRR